MDGQGNLARTWKVREKSGNLKINGYGWLFSGNLGSKFFSVRVTTNFEVMQLAPFK